ncbi:hypothetical protein IW261DRAFT_1598246, partial [Armillaria novae-zelandiae]
MAIGIFVVVAMMSAAAVSFHWDGRMLRSVEDSHARGKYSGRPEMKRMRGNILLEEEIENELDNEPNQTFNRVRLCLQVTKRSWGQASRKVSELDKSWPAYWLDLYLSGNSLVSNSLVVITLIVTIPVTRNLNSNNETTEYADTHQYANQIASAASWAFMLIDPNAQDTSDSVKKSLEHLQLDDIDILHRQEYNTSTPIHEMQQLRMSSPMTDATTSTVQIFPMAIRIE